MFDAHCHLDFPIFDTHREALIEDAKAQGIAGMLVAGVDREGWQRQRALAERFNCVHLAYGLHPWKVAEMSDLELPKALDALDKALAGSGRIMPVALGETGLDRSRKVDAASMPRQERAFRSQLAMARAWDLPVILHVVKAQGRALEIIQSDGLPQAGGMIHAFSGSPEMAKEWIRAGLHLSFSTAIARSQAKKMRRAAANVPLERLLSESDAPDQTPYPQRDEPNVPANLPLAIKELAIAQGLKEETLAEACAQNARRLFRL